MSALKELMSKFPLRQDKFQDRGKLATAREARIGRGFVYEAIVSRAGVGDISYFGLTRRTIIKRRDEHISAAEKLGPLGSAAGGIKAALSFPKKATPLQVLLRTAIGTVNTDTKRAEKYLTVLERGNPSIFGMMELERKLITSENDFGDKRRYDTTFGFTNLNQTGGGGGVAWKHVASIDKAVAAYIYLREDSTGIYQYIKGKASRSKLYNEEDFLLLALYSLYTGKNHLNNPKALLSSGLKVMVRHLEDYYSFGEEVDAYLEGDARFSTTIERKIYLGLMGRKTSITQERAVKDFRKNIAPLTEGDIGIRSQRIYAHFSSDRQYPKREKARSEINKGINKYMEEVLDELIKTILEQKN